MSTGLLCSPPPAAPNGGKSQPPSSLLAPNAIRVFPRVPLFVLAFEYLSANPKNAKTREKPPFPRNLSFHEAEPRSTRMPTKHHLQSRGCRPPICRSTICDSVREMKNFQSRLRVRAQKLIPWKKKCYSSCFCALFISF